MQKQQYQHDSINLSQTNQLSLNITKLITNLNQCQNNQSKYQSVLLLIYDDLKSFNLLQHHHFNQQSFTIFKIILKKIHNYPAQFNTTITLLQNITLIIIHIYITSFTQQQNVQFLQQIRGFLIPQNHLFNKSKGYNQNPIKKIKIDHIHVNINKNQADIYEQIIDKKVIQYKQKQLKHESQQLIKQKIKRNNNPVQFDRYEWSNNDQLSQLSIFYYKCVQVIIRQLGNLSIQIINKLDLHAVQQIINIIYMLWRQIKPTKLNQLTEKYYECIKVILKPTRQFYNISQRLSTMLYGCEMRQLVKEIRFIKTYYGLKLVMQGLQHEVRLFGIIILQVMAKRYHNNMSDLKSVQWMKLVCRQQIWNILINKNSDILLVQKSQYIIKLLINKYCNSNNSLLNYKFYQFIITIWSYPIQLIKIYLNCIQPETLPVAINTKIIQSIQKTIYYNTNNNIDNNNINSIANFNQHNINKYFNIYTIQYFQLIMKLYRLSFKNQTKKIYEMVKQLVTNTYNNFNNIILNDKCINTLKYVFDRYINSGQPTQQLTLVYYNIFNSLITKSNELLMNENILQQGQKNRIEQNIKQNKLMNKQNNQIDKISERIKKQIMIQLILYKIVIKKFEYGRDESFNKAINKLIQHNHIISKIISIIHILQSKQHKKYINQNDLGEQICDQQIQQRENLSRQSVIGVRQLRQILIFIIKKVKGSNMNKNDFKNIIIECIRQKSVLIQLIKDCSRQYSQLALSTIYQFIINHNINIINHNNNININNNSNNKQLNQNSFQQSYQQLYPSLHNNNQNQLIIKGKYELINRQNNIKNNIINQNNYSSIQANYNIDPQIIELLFFKVNHQLIDYTSSCKYIQINTNNPNQLIFVDKLFYILKNINNKPIQSKCASIITIIYTHFNPQFQSEGKSKLNQLMLQTISQIQNISELSTIRQSSIKSQIQNIKSSSNNLQNTSSSQKSNSSKSQTYIYGILSLIKQIMYATQIYGVGKIKSHNSLINISTIKVKIINKINHFEHYNHYKYYQKLVPSNTTLFQLLNKLAFKFKCGWHEIILQKSDFTIIPMSMNGHTLQQLNFGQYYSQNLQARKNSTFKLKRQPLLINKQLNPRFIKILKQIFNQVCNKQRKVGEIQIINFIQLVTKSTLTIQDRRVINLLTEYGNSEGYLQQQGFIRFYKDSCGQDKKQQVVWQNIKNAGYRQDLSRCNQSILMPREQTRFRYYLKDSNKLYRLLFQLIKRYEYKQKLIEDNNKMSDNLYNKNKNRGKINQQRQQMYKLVRQILLHLPTSRQMLNDQLLGQNKNELDLIGNNLFETNYIMVNIKYLLQRQLFNNNNLNNKNKQINKNNKNNLNNLNNLNNKNNKNNKNNLNNLNNKNNKQDTYNHQLIQKQKNNNNNNQYLNNNNNQFIIQNNNNKHNKDILNIIKQSHNVYQQQQQFQQDIFDDYQQQSQKYIQKNKINLQSLYKQNRINSIKQLNSIQQIKYINQIKQVNSIKQMKQQKKQQQKQIKKYIYKQQKLNKGINSYIQRQINKQLQVIPQVHKMDIQFQPQYYCNINHNNRDMLKKNIDEKNSRYNNNKVNNDNNKYIDLQQQQQISYDYKQNDQEQSELIMNEQKNNNNNQLQKQKQQQQKYQKQQKQQLIQVQNNGFNKQQISNTQLLQPNIQLLQLNKQLLSQNKQQLQLDKYILQLNKIVLQQNKQIQTRNKQIQKRNKQIQTRNKQIQTRKKLLLQQKNESHHNNKTSYIKHYIKYKYDIKIYNIIQYLYNKQYLTKQQQSIQITSIHILRTLINFNSLSDQYIKSIQYPISYIIQSINHINTLNLSPSNYNLFTNILSTQINHNNYHLYQPLLALSISNPKITWNKWIQKSIFNNNKSIRRITLHFLIYYSVKYNYSINFINTNPKIIPEYCQQFFILLFWYLSHNNNDQLISNLQLIFKQLLNQQQSINISTFNTIMNRYIHLIQYIFNTSQGNIIINILKITIFNLLTQALQKTISSTNRLILYQLIYQVDSNKTLTLLLNLIKSIKQIKPTDKYQPKSNFVGIKNLGSTCYMNSILQQFFMISSFKNIIVNFPLSKIPQKTDVNGNQIIDDFLFQLQKMYISLESSQNKFFYPKQFCLTLKDYDQKPINTSIQQDAHQFLNTLFSQIQKYFKQSNKLQSLQNIFLGKTACEIVCSQCRSKISKQEDFYHLSLEVKGISRLMQSFKRFTAPQQIQDYKCDTCKKHSTITKQTTLYQLPQILIINLQRIIFDLQSQRHVKVHSQLQFGQIIDLQQVKHESKKYKTQSYHLKGVVIHSGTSGGGHYYSLIKVNDDWYKFDDQNVQKVSYEQVKRLSFGGGLNNYVLDQYHSTNAYILFYEMDTSKNSYRNDKSCETMADYERIQSKQKILQKDNSFNVINNKKKFIQQNAIYFTPTPQYQPSISITTQKLKKQVIQQNRLYYRQRQINQQSYFEFINKLYQQIRINQVFNQNCIIPYYQQWRLLQHKPCYQQLFQIYLQIIKFVSICGLKLSDRMFYQTTIVICQLIMLLPQKTQYLLINYIDYKKWTQIICIYDDQKVRQMYKIILSKIILVYGNYFNYNLFNIKSQSNQYQSNQPINKYCQSIANIKLQQILTYLINTTGSQLISKNIYKTFYFFQLWRYLLDMDQRILKFTIHSDFLFYLLDLLMGNQSIYAIKDKKRQDLSYQLAAPLIHCASKLIQFKRNHIGAVYFKNHQLNQQLFTSLTQQQLQILSSVNFYKRMMKSKYDNGALPTIVICMCYKDKNLSKQLSKLFLTCINDLNEVDNIFSLLNNITRFLQIQDQYQQFRLQSMLGIYQLYSTAKLNNQIVSYGLGYSCQSQIVKYYSTLYFGDDDKHKSLLQLLYQKKSYQTQFEANGIIALLDLISSSITILKYILNTPPPSYLHETYLTWIYEYINKNYVQIQESKQTPYQKNISRMKIMYQMIQQQMKTIKELPNIPIMSKIIGKNKNVQFMQQIKGEDDIFSIKIYTHVAYVMNNLPIKNHRNESLPEQVFSIKSLRSYAYYFVEHGDIKDCDMQILSQKAITTLFIISKRGLILKFSHPKFKYEINISKGQSRINYPFLDSELSAYLKIQIKQQQQQKNKEQMNKNIVDVVNIMYSNNNRMISEQQYDEINCKACTFLNPVNRFKCIICETQLY